jgi:hypothetical protein
MSKLTNAARALSAAIAVAALPMPAFAAGYGSHAAPEVGIEITYGAAGGYYSGYRRHGHWHHDRHYERRVCRPGEAVEKAHWMGLRRAGIHRVSHDVIVVAGIHYGDWATVVFDRWSPYCRVIATRGI